MEYFHKIIVNEISNIKTPSTNGINVLILGCGLSPLPKLIWEECRLARLDMLDYNKSCVDYQTQIFRDIHTVSPDKILVIQADLTRPETMKDLRYPYDVIIFTEVLEHLPQDQPVFKNIVEFMGQNTRLIMSVPTGWIDRLMLKINHGYMQMASGDCGHRHFYTRRDIEKLALTNDLSIQRYIPTNAGYSFSHFIINLTRIPVDGDYGGIKYRNLADKIICYGAGVGKIILDLPVINWLTNRIIPRNMLFIIMRKEK